jgi:hypothetical protein
MISSHLRSLALRASAPLITLTSIALLSAGFFIPASAFAAGPNAPEAITSAATNVTTSDATLNGANGDNDATGHSFWVSTSPISTSSPSIPSGVYSTPDMGAIVANAAFAPTQLSSLTTDGAPSDMPAVTPGTTYYYVAWTDVDGTWYPGEQQQFTTSAAPTPTYTVTIDKFLDTSAATATSADNNAFPMDATWNATNIGSGAGSYTLSPAGFNSPNAYEAVTADMTSGASYTTNEDTTGDLVGASCSDGKPYALAGYSSGATEADAQAATMSATPPDFTNLTSNENVIVWNVTCPPPDTTPPVVTVTPVAGSNLSGTVTFDITLSDNEPLDPTKNTNVWVYLYNSAPPQADQGANVDLSSGHGTFTVDTTQLANGDAWLDVGQVFDAAGNANGPIDNYFKDYTIDNTGTPTGPNAPEVITEPASGQTSSDATVNGMNGDNDASGHSIWVSLAPFVTTSPNIPAGVYSTPDMGAISANGDFSATLSSLTGPSGDAVTTGGATGVEMPAVMPNTTYYYTAWSLIDGTWYPGEQLRK